MADNNSTSFGSVFASGIQDVAAVAAVLGTDICDKNAGLALTKGYLFPAACGMSMFGVLGLAKHILKSFLPLDVAENLGIEVEKFDTYRIDKAMSEEAELLFKRRERLQRQNAEVTMRVDAYNRRTWTFALISCLFLSCVNLIPYIPHYKTLYSIPGDSPDSSDSYLYFPLLLAFSSSVASFVCWFDAAIMLSGRPSLYPLAGSFMDIFIPYYFGNIFIRYVGYGVGLIAAVGTVIGYIGSYLVVQNMTPTDTYYWLGLELALCFLRLVIWSWNTSKDDLDVIELRYRIDRSDEGIIRQIKELPLRVEQAEDAITRVKAGGCFIQSQIVDAYFQAKHCIHEVYIERLNDINVCALINSLHVFQQRPSYYIMWNDKMRCVDKFLVVSDKVGLIVQTEVYHGLSYYAHHYVRILWKESNLYYLEETDLEPLEQEQIGDEDQEKLKAREKDMYLWIDAVKFCMPFDPDLKEDEQLYKYVDLKNY